MENLQSLLRGILSLMRRNYSRSRLQTLSLLPNPFVASGNFEFERCGGGEAWEQTQAQSVLKLPVEQQPFPFRRVESHGLGKDRNSKEVSFEADEFIAKSRRICH